MNKPEILPPTPALPAVTTNHGATAGTISINEAAGQPHHSKWYEPVMDDMTSLSIKLTQTDLVALNQAIQLQSSTYPVPAQVLVNLHVLRQIQIKVRTRFYRLKKARKQEGKFTLLLSQWVALHTFLLDDYDDMYLRLAIGKIDTLVKNHSHVTRLTR